MAGPSFTNFLSISAGTPTAAIPVKRTAAVLVAQTGVVHVAPANNVTFQTEAPAGANLNSGGFCNMGTIAGGTLLPIEISQVGTLNTAGLVLMY